MTRNVLLAIRLREVFLEGKWIANTNYKEQLLSLSWEEAIHKVDPLNNIALLTFHVNYYLKGLLHVMNGGRLEIRDAFSFDLPEIKAEADWSNLVTELLSNARLFSDKVEQMAEEILDQVFVEEKYGNYARNIEAIIEHSYYHLGQISLLKKIITNRKSQDL
jgi:hypothetical protein